MSKTTHYELNTPIGSEVLSVMTGLNPNFNTIDETMYDNETRSTQALNKANVNEQNIATALGRITTAEGDIDTLESGLETANTNISGLTSRMATAESNIVSANNRIQENTGNISTLQSQISNKVEYLNNSITRTPILEYTTFVGDRSFIINSKGFLKCSMRNSGNGGISLFINNIEIFTLSEESGAVIREDFIVPVDTNTNITLRISGNNNGASLDLIK